MDPEPSVDMSYMIYRYLHTEFRIRIQLNPDPAKNLNPYPDLDPEDLESGSGSMLPVFLYTI